MKIYLTYGFAIMLGNALVTLVCYLLGFHSDPDKVQTAGYIAALIGLAIGITATTLGMRAKRNTTPSTEEFSFGQAFVTGFMITLFAALPSAAFHYVYLAFINPDFTGIIQQAQTAKLEAKGLSSEQIERAQNFIRPFLKPAAQAVFGIIGTLSWGTIISLIAAAFVKRPASPPAATT
ncbi:MAG TPA: DUF4199 domain-containing protein [Opitutaceae bacterium]|jgi:hypothetical protein|nr:DUF4199 domain-containing protein [Opitutaceae bacterium]